MVRFSRCAPPVEFNPGSARAAKLTQSPQRGQALFLIQDKPATIFTIAKTGAMLFIGQIRSRETTALTVEPSCVSDSKFCYITQVDISGELYRPAERL
jgi:hypothetical protein